MLGLLLLTPTAEAAPKVFTQGPCASGGDACKTFYAHSPIPTIRTLTFTAPRAGVALVTFNGTMSCTSGDGSYTYVDLASQIQTGPGTANPNGAGGARHLVVLDAVYNLTPTVEINLASTRTINFRTGGQKTLYFRITKRRMDAGTACYVYNPVFTVLYLS